MMDRRRLLTGMGAVLIASPAIVRATSLMPVSAWADELPAGWSRMLWGHPMHAIDADTYDAIMRASLQWAHSITADPATATMAEMMQGRRP